MREVTNFANGSNLMPPFCKICYFPLLQLSEEKINLGWSFFFSVWNFRTFTVHYDHKWSVQQAVQCLTFLNVYSKNPLRLPIILGLRRVPGYSRLGSGIPITQPVNQRQIIIKFNNDKKKLWLACINGYCILPHDLCVQCHKYIYIFSPFPCI